MTKIRKFLTSPKFKKTIAVSYVAAMAIELVLESVRLGKEMNEEGWGG